MQRLLRSGRIQPRPTIGSADDAYEEEADRVAEQVMRMPDPRLQRQIEPEEEEEEEEEEVLQPKRLAEQITPLIQRQAEPEDEEEEGIIQTKRAGGPTRQISPSLAAQIHALGGRGRPLTQSERGFFEPRFGRSLSRVRIHTDARAAKTAQALKARALTAGRNVVFGASAYVPETMSGQHLLAHELTHVAQQPADNGSSSGTAMVSRPSDVAEREAERVAGELAAGARSARVVEVAAPSVVHRTPVVGRIAGELIRGYLEYRCLRPLIPEMSRETLTFIRNYCRTLPRQTTESRLVYSPRTRAPRTELTTSTLTAVPNNHYDAFGHCWIGCAGSRRCGREAAARLGTAREIWRELDQDPHDSFSQDLRNQAYGRQVSDERGSCLTLCEQAVMDGRLDLSAPIRHCRDCTTGDTTTDCGPGVQVRPERPGEGPGCGWLPSLR
jgi:hypothetical protein